MVRVARRGDPGAERDVVHARAQAQRAGGLTPQFRSNRASEAATQVGAGAASASE